MIPITRLIWKIFLIGILILSGSLSNAADGTTQTLTELDRYFEQARRDWKIPGMAVAIVKDGRIILAKGYGKRHFQKKERVDKDTLFAIASNTKAFTAAALSILVDEGRIGWQDKVRKYLPYFQLYDPYVSKAMTIEDLLCHRSGLGTFSGDLLWYETSYDLVEVIKRARFLKPVFGFRAGFGYSNIMFLAAGEIVASVSGKTWAEFVEERIFKPLRMGTSHTGVEKLKYFTNVAIPHAVSHDGGTVTVPYTTSEQIGAAGSINSSVYEMAQWLKMMLAQGEWQGKQILSRKGIWKMWSVHNVFKVSESRKKLFPSNHFRGYGLGWGMEDYHGRKLIGHGGGLDGMISRVMLVPEENLGIVILTNSINSLPPALGYRIVDAFFGVPGKDWSGIYLERFMKHSQALTEKGKKSASKSSGYAWSPIDLKEFEGIFKDPMYGEAHLRLEKNSLVLDLIPTPIFTSDLEHIEYNTFYLKLRNKFSFIPGGGGRVQFKRDMDGRITGMVLDIPNDDFLFSELKFKKIK